MKNLKRFFILLITLLLIIGTIPAAAFAQDSQTAPAQSVSEAATDTPAADAGSETTDEDKDTAITETDETQTDTESPDAAGQTVTATPSVQAEPADGGEVQEPTVPSAPSVDTLRASASYKAHVQNYGWMDSVNPAETAGTTGQALRVESFVFSTGQDAASLGATYRAYVQNYGWMDWKTDGQEAGTTGRGLRLEALEVKLTGEYADQYDIYYRLHVRDLGWLGWSSNGESAGTAGLSLRAEAIQVQIVEKGAASPGVLGNSFIDENVMLSQTHVNLRGHVQNYGWRDWVTDGAVCGTTGEGLQMEALTYNVSSPYGFNDISCNAYLQDIGWQGWRSANSQAGTTGQNRRIEAVEFSLSGISSRVFDIYYRVHAANLGWMGWASNGAPAGTCNGSIRVEAVQVVLVPKGHSAPGDTNGAFREIDRRLGFSPLSPNCICISISQQRMCLYQNYNCTVDTPVVTGMFGIDDTRTGNFSIQDKFTNYRTVGPGYDSTVDYWLTIYIGQINGFYGGSIVDRVGIHDAPWRTYFGGNIYLNNGSHGCVNTPDGAMAAIFNSVGVGTPVYVR